MSRPIPTAASRDDFDVLTGPAAPPAPRPAPPAPKRG
jgi:hypothetical protein